MAESHAKTPSEVQRTQRIQSITKTTSEVQRAQSTQTIAKTPSEVQRTQSHDLTAQTSLRGTQAHNVKVKAADITFQKRKVFNDPIHGQIELHPVCCRIIDTPQFQRLRHIKQLDTCYLVYPGASHNRFEHSLGVYHLAGKLMKIIRDRHPDENITETDILCVEIAGLCHDLGQGPFSHVFEKKFMPMKSKTFMHENMARKMFEFMLQTDKGKLKKDIDTELIEYGMETFKDDDYTFICEMIDDQKNLEQAEWPYKGRGEDKSYMYEIVANKRNGIDVDKWDYLARDSYMLGMKCNVDHNRCFTNARVIKCNGVQGENGTVIPLRKQICYREKEAQDLYDMFYSRMTLHRRAYQHKTHKIIGMMILDALIAADKHFKIKGKRISETVDDLAAYTYLTDDVIQMIVTDKNERLKDAQKLLEDIMYRRLYKCVKQQPCDKLAVTEETVRKGINEIIGQLHMQEGSFHCDIVKFNYGMDCNNPMEKVRFYNKDNLNKPLSINKNQVSFILPDNFQECVIRIYCKHESEKQKETAHQIVDAFEKWWKGSPYSVKEQPLEQKVAMAQNESNEPSEPREPESPEPKWCCC